MNEDDWVRYMKELFSNIKMNGHFTKWRQEKFFRELAKEIIKEKND